MPTQVILRRKNAAEEGKEEQEVFARKILESSTKPAITKSSDGLSSGFKHSDAKGIDVEDTLGLALDYVPQTVVSPLPCFSERRMNSILDNSSIQEKKASKSLSDEGKDQKKSFESHINMEFFEEAQGFDLGHELLPDDTDFPHDVSEFKAWQIRQNNRHR